MHDAVTVHMSATPDKFWGLVSDVTKTGQFSPETFEAEWLDGATGPAVDARFRGHVNRNGWGLKYHTTCRVTACEPGKVFEFAVEQNGKATSTWRYEIVAADDGVDVTESFRLADMLPLKIYWALWGWSRGKVNRNGMRTTLERIKAVAEEA